MLDDCRDSLARRAVDYLFISTHGQQLRVDVAQRLRDAGYRVELSSDFDSETTSHDGLIFASSPEVLEVFTDFRPLSRVQIANAAPLALVESLVSRLRAEP